MKLKHLSVSRERLEALPKEEALFFVFAGHLANEISSLSKILLWSINTSEESEPGLQGWLAQAMLLSRLLAGKLHEANEFLKKNFFGTGLSRTYEALLSERAQEALKEIKRYFSKVNAVTSVRNKYSFHYTLENAMLGIRRLEDYSFDLYIAEEAGNCLYFGSEIVTSLASAEMIALRQGKSIETCMDDFISDVTTISGWFLVFASESIALLMEHHDLADPDVRELEINDLPRLDEVRIPFFVEG